MELSFFSLHRSPVVSGINEPFRDVVSSFTLKGFCVRLKFPACVIHIRSSESARDEFTFKFLFRFPVIRVRSTFMIVSNEYFLKKRACLGYLFP